MVDRSAIMRAVKSRDTAPERTVRRLLRPLAPGYRLNRTDIPGKPDIAYIGRRQAIFVHGCFWHGHNCKRGARTPKQNINYWLAKIARNKTRDADAQMRLEGQGWQVLTIWECELNDEAAALARLAAFLTHPSSGRR